MDDVIYKSSDGRDMTRDDMIAWLKWAKTPNSYYTRWDFDRLTGGIDEFFYAEVYFELRCLFENHIHT